MDSSRRAQVKAYREARDQGAATAALEVVRKAARGSDNLMPLVMQAFKAGATLGSISESRTKYGSLSSDLKTSSFAGLSYSA